MPIIKSAIKRMKQTAAKRERNVSVKRDLKTAVKAFIAKPSAETLSAAQSEIDTMVKKNLMPKNTAARRKSALSRVAKDAGVKLKTTAKSKTTPAAKKPTAKKVDTTATKKPATKPVAAVKKPAAKKPAAKK